MQVTTLLNDAKDAQAITQAASTLLWQTLLGKILVVFNSARLVRQGEALEPFVRPESAVPDRLPVQPRVTT